MYFTSYYNFCLTIYIKCLFRTSYGYIPQIHHPFHNNEKIYLDNEQVVDFYKEIYTPS